VFEYQSTPTFIDERIKHNNNKGVEEANKGQRKMKGKEKNEKDEKK
jgi:hypothetical protein